MNCHVCGTTLNKTITDLPFKRGPRSIIVLRDVPVFECPACASYSIEDGNMERIEQILFSVDKAVELQVIVFAA